jgi:O-antigen ligase
MSALARVLPRPHGPAAGWLALALVTALLVPLLRRGDGIPLLVLVAGAVATAILVRHPFLGVLIVFVGWFLRVGVASYATTLVLLLPLGAAIFVDRRVRALDALQIRVLLGIGGLYLLSTWWNELLERVPWIPGTDETAPQLVIFALRLLFVVYVFYFVTTARRLTVLTWLVIGLITVAALSALPAFLSGSGFRRAHAEFGLAGNANRLAHICAFATALVWFYRCHGGDRRLKTLSLPLLGLLPLVTLLTASRSGLLQLGVLGFFAIREQQGWSPARRLRSMVFAGALAIVGLAFVPSAQLMRATTFDRAHVGQGQDSLKNRFNTVVAGIEVIARDPVLGVGIGNFQAVKRAEHGLPRREGTHNSYLWALLAGGIGALALHLLLFVTTWRVVRHAERHGAPELLWLAKGLKVGLVLFLLFSAFSDFWLSEIFAVVVALPLALAGVMARPAPAPAGASPVPEPAR